MEESTESVRRFCAVLTTDCPTCGYEVDLIPDEMMVGKVLLAPFLIKFEVAWECPEEECRTCHLWDLSPEEAAYLVNCGVPLVVGRRLGNEGQLSHAEVDQFTRELADPNWSLPAGLRREYPR